MIDTSSRETENCFVVSWYSMYHMSWDDNRYRYDWMLKAEDWRKQYDTDQDARYFGVRVNLEKMIIVTYAEWDLTVSIAKDQEAMKRELKRMEDFYWPTPPAFIINRLDWKTVKIYDERPQIA